LGGRAKVVSGFESSFQGLATDAFFVGKIGMKIDGNWILDNIARYASNLDFGVAPPPSPEGKPIISWAGGHSLVIPRGAQHVEEAWEFIKWMTSIEGTVYGGEIQKEFNRTQGRNWFIPSIMANKKVARQLFDHFQLDDPRYNNSIQLFLNLMEVSKYRPVTPVGQILWDEHVRAFENATLHVMTPQQALDISTKNVQQALDNIYRKENYPLLDLRSTFLFVLAILFIALILIYRKNRIYLPKSRMMKEENRYGWFFVSPWVCGFLIFFLGPMIASIILAFCEYDVR
jgi:hypothetical protein